ncbi:ATP-binding cassette domain-containing protein [Metamycoplasma auris]|uniref:ATP-binding cassette domain-containing protein n=1 Tax=Metamycoplasma auris TaxID=51363 RepID=UPI00058EC213
MKIEVNNITKEYNKGLPTYIKVLDNVSVSITEGEAISIIGPTGSGKTTLIEHFNALLSPESGSLKFSNIPIEKKLSKPKKPNRKKINDEEEYNRQYSKYKDDLQKYKSQNKKDRIEVVYTDIDISKTKKKIKNIKALRKQVGVVFQFAEYQLFESTIEKDIIFGAISMGTKKEKAKELAAKYIEIVGLPKDYLERSPFNLSGGQKRRVALAGILAMEPKFLVLDEPTAGLDPQGVDEMLQIFYNLYKNGTTIIIVTHDLDNALRWTNRTLFVKDGKIIKDGNTYEILSDNKLLKDNDLIPTKLLSYTEKLRECGFNISRVTDIEQLANEINKQIKKPNKKRIT